MRNDAIDIVPLTGHMGAEIHGVNLCKPLNDQEFETIHRALLEHLVIFFFVTNR